MGISHDERPDLGINAGRGSTSSTRLSSARAVRSCAACRRRSVALANRADRVCFGGIGAAAFLVGHFGDAVLGDEPPDLFGFVHDVASSLGKYCVGAGSGCEAALFLVRN
jgi:hypothetical protein